MDQLSPHPITGDTVSTPPLNAHNLHWEDDYAMKLHRATPPLFAALLLLASAMAGPASAQANAQEGLSRFYGAYVGSGTAEQVAKNTK
jgi:hypothetical protein